MWTSASAKQSVTVNLAQTFNATLVLAEGSALEVTDAGVCIISFPDGSVSLFSPNQWRSISVENK